VAPAHRRGMAMWRPGAGAERSGHQGEGIASSFREDETSPGSSLSSGRPKAFGVLTSNSRTPSFSPSSAASTRFDRISRGPLVAAGGLRRSRSRHIKSLKRLQSGAERSCKARDAAARRVGRVCGFPNGADRCKTGKKRRSGQPSWTCLSQRIGGSTDESAHRRGWP